MFNFSPTLKKTINNLTWLSVDRIVRLFGAVFVNAWIIRYLGPEQNGILSYAVAFVGLFSPLAVLGMDAIVIRDIVRNPSDKDEILGSSFALRLAGAFLALFFASTAIFFVRSDDTFTRLMVFILCTGMIFQSFDVIDYWFQSQIQSKYTVYAKNIAFFTASFIKIGAIISQASILTFVIIMSVEMMISAVGLMLMYRSRGNVLWNWRFAIGRSKSLLMNSWPIVISDLAVFMQTKIDQIMIGDMLGNSDVGLYAAAQKVSEPLGFIPMIIMSSVFPVIINTKTWSQETYMNRMVNLYRIMFILSILICLPISLFSSQIVAILYGNDYAVAGTILSVSIWSRFYAFYGVARSIYISSENLFRHTLICSIAGIIVSISFNKLLIPEFGVYGAIISTHAGFIVTIFIIDGISSKTRVNFYAMMKGMMTFYKFSIGK